MTPEPTRVDGRIDVLLTAPHDLGIRTTRRRVLGASSLPGVALQPSSTKGVLPERRTRGAKPVATPRRPARDDLGYPSIVPFMALTIRSRPAAIPPLTP